MLSLAFVSTGGFCAANDSLTDQLLPEGKLNYGAAAKYAEKDLLGDTGAPKVGKKKKQIETRILQPSETEYNKMPSAYNHSISFSGAAFYYPYELGVAAYLQKTYDLSNVCFLGASAGAFTSTLLACEADIAGKVMGVDVSKDASGKWKYEITNTDSWIVSVNDYFKNTGVYGHVVEAMKSANSVVPILVDNANGTPDVRATNRATFSLTNMSSWWSNFSLTNISSWWPTNERVSSFGSRDDLVDYGFASAHIPWIVDGNFFASITDANGEKKYIDGGVTDNQPVFNGSTIKVSPYMWSWIWGGYSPLGLLHFYGNTSMDRNYKLYLDGYSDAAKHRGHWAGLTLL